MKHRANQWLKRVAVDLVDLSGLSRAMKPFLAGRGAILALHRVLPDDVELCTPGHMIGVNQLRAILSCARRSGWRFVALDEIPDRLRSRSKERFLALTLDDGYLDNFVYGSPVFSEFNAPFALFPYTNAVNRVSVDFWMLLDALVSCVTTLRVRHPRAGLLEFSMETIDKKRSAIELLTRLRAPLDETYSAVVAAGEVAGHPLHSILDRTFLSWEHLRLLASHPRVTIGVHTVSHANLASLSDEDSYNEMANAKNELTTKLGTAIRHIAYPLGAPANCGEREFRYARELGFLTGMTTTRGNIFDRHREALWSLPRHSIGKAEHSSSIKYVRMSLNGVWDSPLNNRIVSRLRY